MSAGTSIRQRILFGEPVVDAVILDKFNEFLRTERSSDTLSASAEKESAFVRNMLGYYLAMGTFGPASARREKAATDHTVQKAISELPNAGRLASAAIRARTQPKKEKSSLSLVLNEKR